MGVTFVNCEIITNYFARRNARMGAKTQKPRLDCLEIPALSSRAAVAKH